MPVARCPAGGDGGVGVNTYLCNARLKTFIFLDAFPKVQDIFLKQSCRRKALNAAFTLSNVHSEDFFLWILPEQISKYLHSGFYNADEDGQKVCLELSCAVGAVSATAANVCAASCCLASTCDFNFILQQLLIAQPCFSYQ